MKELHDEAKQDRMTGQQDDGDGYGLELRDCGGGKGRGLFTRNFFCAGTVLLEEEPLIASDAGKLAEAAASRSMHVSFLFVPLCSFAPG